MEDASSSDIHVRVVLIGCSGLLGDIIGQTVTAEPILEVVAEIDSSATDDVLAAIEADLVVWNNADEARIARWLSQVSVGRGPRILATLGDGRDASWWELTPHRIELGALSPTTLVATIRNSFEPARGELE